MSFFKKILVFFTVLVSFFCFSCSEGGVLDVASVNATAGGVSVNCVAAAKVSNSEDSIPVVSKLFNDGGTLIYATDVIGNQKIYITYGGKRAGTYKTGVEVENVANVLLEYLIGGDADNLSDTVKDAVNAKANITYVDADGTKWYSTTCEIVITSQVEGSRATLINGRFSANLYSTASANTSAPKVISGKISNVPGF